MADKETTLRYAALYQARLKEARAFVAAFRKQTPSVGEQS